MDLAQVQVLLARLHGNLAAVMRGKPEQIDLLLMCVASAGHALLEDIPGVGKTTLAKTLARSIGGVFKRVQFTPDLLPTDIVGTSVFDQRDGSFRFQPGPVFANVLLADEINRASPRTQSALLEALSESQVTIDGTTHTLAPPFLAVATQNPIEYHGTYPLPEAQLDRFSVRISLGYPPADEERAVLRDQQRGHPLDDIEPVTEPGEVVAMQRAVAAVHMEETVLDYLMAVVRATRGHEQLRLGVSVRGALLLARVARARAALLGRDHLLPEDIKELAVPVLAHRLLLDTRSRYAGVDRSQLVEEIVAQVPVPR